MIQPRMILIMLMLSISLGSFGQTNCKSFFVQVISQEGKFDFCPGQGAVVFTASPGYGNNISIDPALMEYSWLIDGFSYTGQQVTHTFPGIGAYEIQLSARDLARDCQASTVQTVRIGTVPSFGGTSISSSGICAGSPFSLQGVATPTIWTGFSTGVQQTMSIPDGTGAYYESSLVFDVFPDGTQVQSAVDFRHVCLQLEHASFGQLQFELEAPDGKRVLLKTPGAGTAHLGEPVVWDHVTPGKGYNYCFSPTPQLGTMDQTTPLYHEYTDQAGNYYFNAAYLPAGSYTPNQSLDGFAGSPMNGRWTLRVQDTQEGENGHIFGWSLLFADSFYPPSLIFSPQIVSSQWYRGNQPVDKPNAVTLSQPGNYDFTFMVMDDFGCQYDTLVGVEILPVPQAEILSTPEVPVCEGDSALFRVVASNGNPRHWIYQWAMGGTGPSVDIPGATYDSLLVLNPANYIVLVTDTLIGCSASFNLQLTTQECLLTIPNVFTPNGDGINDLFEILNLEHYPGSKIAIFNRWGKRVFEHNDYYGNWWDGANQPNGVYYYVLTYTRLGQRREAHGAVTIIR